MLYTKFQASKANGSEEEDIWILFMYFYGPLDIHLNKIG